MNGLELKRLREKFNLTQQEFGSRLGLGYRAIQNYEKTGHIPERVVKLILYEFSDQNLDQVVAEPEEPYPAKSSVSGWVNVEVPLVHSIAYPEYLKDHKDPLYIENLPKFPFAIRMEGTDGIYRAFEVAGDSMSDGSIKSYPSGTVVLAKEIPPHLWSKSLAIREWDFLIVHRLEGILLKQVLGFSPEARELSLHSLNPLYNDLGINLDDILQLFSVVKKVMDPS